MILMPGIGTAYGNNPLKTGILLRRRSGASVGLNRVRRLFSRKTIKFPYQSTETLKERQPAWSRIKSRAACLSQVESYSRINYF